MAFARLAFFPGGTQGQSRALEQEFERLRSEGSAPSAWRLFVAGPAPGGWQVVVVWDSREDLDTFNRDWLVPAMQRLGSETFQEPPEVRDFETTDVWVDGRRID